MKNAKWNESSAEDSTISDYHQKWGCLYLYIGIFKNIQNRWDSMNAATFSYIQRVLEKMRKIFKWINKWNKKQAIYNIQKPVSRICYDVNTNLKMWNSIIVKCFMLLVTLILYKLFIFSHSFIVLLMLQSHGISRMTRSKSFALLLGMLRDVENTAFKH